MVTSPVNISPVRICMKARQPSGYPRMGGICRILNLEEDPMSTKCAAKTEVYSRVCGFFRPVQQWNKGKKAEFEDRQEYVVEEDRR